MLTKFAEIRMC